MKRKLIIFCSLITIILSCFSFPILAEETVEDIEELAQVDLPDYALDQYFYDNYILLPFIESNSRQYINTNIKGSSSLKFNLVFSDLDVSAGTSFLFGERNNSSLSNAYGSFYQSINNNIAFYFTNNISYSDLIVLKNQLFNIVYDSNKVYINGSLLHTFTYSDFVSDLDIYLFGINESNSLLSSSNYKLYKCSIYDYSANDGNGAYVRYYYPAKSKSGGVIGLYDSITKTFVTTSGSTPFSSPLDDQVLNIQIGSFLTNSLIWIGQIFDAIIQMPIIIVFMAIGLAGAMFRWGRRIVHF